MNQIDTTDIFQLQTTFAQCYPGMGFSISDGEPGETLYDKLYVVKAEKPTFEEFRQEAEKQGIELV